MLASNERGFTLIEMLLNLVVVTILLTLPYSFSLSKSLEIEEELFFTQLENKMNQMQLYAIASNQQSYIDINAQGIRCSIPQQEEHGLNEWIEYPDSIQLKSRPFFFYFIGGSGRTNRFGSLSFQTSKGEVKIVFQISNGRYRIQKE